MDTSFHNNMIHDSMLDKLICEVLCENDKIYFNELLSKLKSEKSRSTTPKRLSIHLKKMEEERIIHRDLLDHGRCRYIWLSEEAKLELKLGIFEGLDPKENQKLSREKKQKKSR